MKDKPARAPNVTETTSNSSPGLKIAVGGLSIACVALAALSAYLLLHSSSGASAPEMPAASEPGAAAPKAPPGTQAAEPASTPAPDPIAAVPAAAWNEPKEDKSNLNLLLAASGAKAEGCDKPELLVDGKSDDYNAYASYDINAQPDAHMTVTLKDPAPMNRLRFKLWDNDQRTYRYVASVTTDGKEWTVVADAKARECRGWQEVEFDLQNVKAVRVKGLSSTANSGFHLLELEGYNDGPRVPKRQPSTAAVEASEGALKPGVWAEYFDRVGRYPNIEDRPMIARPEATIHFGERKESLGAWPFADRCAAIFSGMVKIEDAGLYTFYLSSDDGSRLYVDGKLLIDNDGNHGMTEQWEQLDLAPGLHRVWVEYYNAGGPMGLSVLAKHKDGYKAPLGDKDGLKLFHDPEEVITTMRALPAYGRPALASRK